MLFVLVTIGGERYGIEGTKIHEIVPCVKLETLQNGNSFVSHGLSYHGKIIPVIDVSSVLKNQPSHKSLSTRIVIVATQQGPGEDFVGLIAEEVTETANYRNWEAVDMTSMDEGQCIREVQREGDAAEVFRVLSVDHLLSQSFADSS